MIHDRTGVKLSSEIASEADSVWRLLIDWAGILQWWLPPEAGGRPGPRIVSCKLVGAGDAVPRMRRVTLDTGLVVSEELFYENPASTRIYYRMLDVPGSDVSGYVATTFVEAIGPKSSRMTIASSFDVSPVGGAAAARARMEVLYASIFEGFRHCLT